MICSPQRNIQISVCPLIREIVCDIYNNIGDKYSIDVELGAENAIVLGVKIYSAEHFSTS